MIPVYISQALKILSCQSVGVLVGSCRESKDHCRTLQQHPSVQPHISHSAVESKRILAIKRHLRNYPRESATPFVGNRSFFSGRGVCSSLPSRIDAEKAIITLQ